MEEHDDSLRPLSALQVRTLDEAVTAYQTALAFDSRAQDALLGRGVTEDAASIHRLGVVGADCLPEHRRFIGWLTIPYIVAGGDVVQVRFRCLQDHDHIGHGKYMTIEGDPARVFNTRVIPRADFEIHVTEGEFDSIILNQLGYPAVAIPGASGFQSHHRRMLAGFERVYVWGDPDEAGAAFAARVTRAMNQAVSVRLDDGDINETFLLHGEDAIHEAIAQVAAK